MISFVEKSQKRGFDIEKWLDSCIKSATLETYVRRYANQQKKED